MKDIKKLLKQQSSNILPDENIKDEIKADLGLTSVRAQSVAYNTGGTATTHTSSKRLPVFIAILLVLVIVTGVILFALPSGNGGLNIGGKFDDIVTTDDFYAYGAASIGALIDSNAPQTVAVASDMTFVTVADTVEMFSLSDGYGKSNTLTDEQMQTVNGYMALVEELLGSSKITHSGAVSDRAEYQYVMTINSTDITGAKISYTMYYNKILVGVDTEHDEQEETYNIQGVLQIGTNEYPVEGEYVSETEQGESETEMYFRAYTSVDSTGNYSKNSYIEVHQQNESEAEDNETEKEYVYTIYQDGRQVERTVAEYEQEGGEIELVLNVSKNGSTNRLVFRNASKGNQYKFSVSARMDGQSINFVVSIVEENGNSVYRYEYSDGSYSDCDRNDHKGWQGGNHDDDDDDDDD